MKIELNGYSSFLVMLQSRLSFRRELRILFFLLLTFDHGTFVEFIENLFFFKKSFELLTLIQRLAK